MTIEHDISRSSQSYLVGHRYVPWESVGSWFVYEIHSVTFAHRRASDTGHQSSDCICNDVTDTPRLHLTHTGRCLHLPRPVIVHVYSLPTSSHLEASERVISACTADQGIRASFRSSESLWRTVLYTTRTLWWPCNTIKWWIYPTWWWWWFNGTNLSLCLERRAIYEVIMH